MNSIIFGDCRETLRRLARDGVRAQTCVTSPPYFGLRDYGVAGQLGLEQTTEQYVAAMVDVFRAVRDVLADDGTLWLNIGDSYADSWGNQGRKPGHGTQRPINGEMMQPVHDGRYTSFGAKTGSLERTPGCKPKDLIGVPWMLAFALRADGWYLRQDIIWHKPNPMPESVRDRCTKAHEYVFLLSKSDRYYFDAESIKEPASENTHPRISRAAAGAIAQGVGHRMGPPGNPAPRKSATTNRAGIGFMVKNNASFDAAMAVMPGTRNKRSVWTVAPRPYKGAHFATFPPALIEPCVLAGSRPGDIVLDPFMGSGTTAAVAIQHGRQYLGCELQVEYAPLQDERIRGAQREREESARLPAVRDLFDDQGDIAA